MQDKELYMQSQTPWLGTGGRSEDPFQSARVEAGHSRVWVLVADQELELTKVGLTPASLEERYE